MTEGVRRGKRSRAELNILDFVNVGIYIHSLEIGHVDESYIEFLLTSHIHVDVFRPNQRGICMTNLLWSYCAR